MNAIDLLKNDHRRVMGMIDRLENQEPETINREIFDQLKEALNTHTGMEERVFYPALENISETSALVEKSYKEHREVNEILTLLDGLKDGARAEDWKMSLGDLRRTVEHHIAEEENELFPRAEQRLGATALQEMLDEMERIRTGQSETDSLIYPPSRLGYKE